VVVVFLDRIYKIDMVKTPGEGKPARPETGEFLSLRLQSPINGLKRRLLALANVALEFDSDDTLYDGKLYRIL